MYSRRERIIGAIFYGISSLLITLVNKYLFALWNFPSSSVVALSQFTATPIIVLSLKQLGLIDFPSISIEAVVEVFPLPIIYLFNTAFGLAGTKMLSIPMFGVLRRLTLLFTLILERIILSSEIKRQVVFALSIMMIGSFIAAANDLAFDLTAYLVILGNDVLTALNGVVSKLKLNKSNQPTQEKASDEEGEAFIKKDESMSTSVSTKGLGTWGLLFYNSGFSAPLLAFLIGVASPDDYVNVRKFEYWFHPGFLFLFFLSTIMGTVLQFSIIYCTKVNSALTTSVTGTLKNMLTTYLGMISPGLDYIYTFANFVGVNISLFGGVYYAWYKFSANHSK